MQIDYWQKFEYGQIYHVYNRAVSRRNLFEDDNDYTRFLSTYGKYFGHFLHTLGYCLMPNHFHLLVQVKSAAKIKKGFGNADSAVLHKYLQDNATIDEVIVDAARRLFSSHSIYINKKRSERGPLFVKRFKRVGIDPERRLDYILAYIHHNPIHHGFVTQYTDWKYSSYMAYHSQSTSHVERSWVLSRFGGRTAFESYHQTFQKEYASDYHLDT